MEFEKNHLKLTCPEDYHQWSYLLKQHWGLDDRKHEILTGEMDMEGIEFMGLNANLKKAYYNAETKMKIEVVKTLSKEYSRLVLNQERFVIMWQTLEKAVVGEKRTRLLALTRQIRRLEWKENMKKLVTKFKELTEEYRLLSGTLSDGDLAEELVAIIPQEYAHVEYTLRRVRSQQGTNLLDLTELMDESLVADLQLKHKKFRSANSTTQKPKKSKQR